MGRYQGLDPALKQAVFARDNYRCRWCGVTNAYGYDAHHIRYRRGYSDDTLDNLITLCRTHHNLVHDSYRIPKAEAQEILWHLASAGGQGRTGMSMFRRPGLVVEGEKTDGRLLAGEVKGYRLISEPAEEYP